MKPSLFAALWAAGQFGPDEAWFTFCKAWGVRKREVVPLGKRLERYVPTSYDMLLARKMGRMWHRNGYRHHSDQNTWHNYALSARKENKKWQK